MREINLNGYIDDEIWFGDEITPETLHGVLYGAENQNADDVHIRLNSYGGSCNAATRMFDDIRAYPGNVTITISGTAASAATVLSMAADKLEMTPGSLYMVHDPSTIAIGNERDLLDAINLLRACKESILNVYAKRCKKPRDEIAALMSATTWMDAQAALTEGFIDGVTEDEQTPGVTNAVKPHTVDRAEAEAKVKAWFDRHTADTTAAHTYGALQLVAGAIEASVTPENADPDVQYADDVEFSVIYPDPELSFKTKMADLPLAVQEQIFGNEIDNNGVLVRKAGDTPGYFAVGFKSEKSDGNFRYVWLFKVRAKPVTETYATKEGATVTRQTGEVEWTAIKRTHDGLYQAVADEGENGFDATDGAAFLSNVYEPSFTTTP